MRNSAIYVNGEVLERAIAKKRKDPVKTGGTLAKLVELLLWEYIGSPPDLLEKDQEREE